MVLSTRTGLLGGSFDPVHRGHIALALAAHRALALDEIQLLPAGRPWQRSPLAASAAHRLAMLELAAAPHACLRINRLELDYDGPTYTACTLDRLPAGPDDHWIMGADQLENFCTWERWQDIAATVRLVVAQRPGSRLVAPAALSAHLSRLDRPLIEIDMPPLAISATQIRARLAQGADIRDLVDPAVADYIGRHGLYTNRPLTV